mmetsp:Transcript_66960/g.178330  ORF Transcript_66960/g.178330 Transcript_66960/m.178330 type:complete len:236 (+) Transcript_66960:516-1223(+)
MGNGVVDRPHRIGSLATARVREEFERHELYAVPRNASDPNPVVANARDGPGTVRPMLLVVHRIAILIGKVRPVDVVDKAVPIIVHAIVWDLAGVHPHVVVQVLMRVVDARVDDGNNDAGAELARELPPRLGGINVVVLDLVHAPKRREVGIVWKTLLCAAEEPHDKLLPVSNLVAVGVEPAVLFGHNVLAKGTLERHAGVLVLDHLELLPVANEPRPSIDASLLAGSHIVPEVRS